jgi:hypothetical protein
VFWSEDNPATQQLDAKYSDLLSQPLTGLNGNAMSLQRLAGKWTIYATLSGTLDVDGLLHEESLRQLPALKSLATQFHANGLQTIIALRLSPESSRDKRYLANAISDLDFDTAIFVAAPGNDGNTSKDPLILLVSPERHVIMVWSGGAKAAELGLTLRQKLGNPAYSRIGETITEH